jgi:hypothetical protein
MSFLITKFFRSTSHVYSESKFWGTYVRQQGMTWMRQMNIQNAGLQPYNWRGWSPENTVIFSSSGSFKSCIIFPDFFDFCLQNLC